MNFTKLENLLLNMQSGLLPQDLCKDEIELLVNEYGNNWFEKLGYKESEYKKPE